MSVCTLAMFLLGSGLFVHFVLMIIKERTKDTPPFFLCVHTCGPPITPATHRTGTEPHITATTRQNTLLHLSWIKKNQSYCDLVRRDVLTLKDAWVSNHCICIKKKICNEESRQMVFHRERSQWCLRKRKCTTGEKSHRTHWQECRLCVMHLLPPRCYYYLGTQPGVMVCQLFPRCPYWHPSAAPWHLGGTLGEGRGRQQSACGCMWSGGEHVRSAS